MEFLSSPYLPLRSWIARVQTWQFILKRVLLSTRYSLATGASSDARIVEVWASERWRPSVLLNYSNSVVASSDWFIINLLVSPSLPPGPCRRDSWLIPSSPPESGGELRSHLYFQDAVCRQRLHCPHITSSFPLRFCNILFHSATIISIHHQAAVP